MTKNIDKRIIDKGFHTGHEVDFVTIQQSDYEYLKEQSERVQELEELLTQIKYDKEAYIALSEKYLKKQLQNKRYREALELLVKQEKLGKDVKTGKTAISYNGMIALKGLGVFNDDNYIVYGVDEIIESVLEESK